MKNYLIGAAGMYLAAVVALQSSICQKSPETTAVAVADGNSRRSSAPETPVLQKLSKNKDYLILVDDYEEIKALSAVVGFSGQYGHIEFISGGRVYGCRPPRCSEISLAELERKFPGRRFEVREMERAVESSGDEKREVESNADQNKAVSWFKQNLEGKVYDLLYRNCTDAIVGMYEAGRATARNNDEAQNNSEAQKGLTIFPLDVEKTYAANERLRRVMAARDLPKPKRASVYFPDQFTRVGKLTCRGKFNR